MEPSDPGSIFGTPAKKKSHLLGPPQQKMVLGVWDHRFRSWRSWIVPRDSPLGADTGKGIIFMPIKTLLSTPSYLTKTRLGPWWCNLKMISNAQQSSWSQMVYTVHNMPWIHDRLVEFSQFSSCLLPNKHMGGLLAFTTMHIQPWKLTHIPEERI